MRGRVAGMRRCQNAEYMPCWLQMCSWVQLFRASQRIHRGARLRLWQHSCTEPQRHWCAGTRPWCSAWRILRFATPMRSCHALPMRSHATSCTLGHIPWTVAFTVPCKSLTRLLVLPSAPAAHPERHGLWHPGIRSGRQAWVTGSGRQGAL